jgi:hypothetical protein
MHASSAQGLRVGEMGGRPSTNRAHFPIKQANNRENETKMWVDFGEDGGSRGRDEELSSERAASTNFSPQSEERTWRMFWQSVSAR